MFLSLGVISSFVFVISMGLIYKYKDDNHVDKFPYVATGAFTSFCSVACFVAHFLLN